MDILTTVAFSCYLSVVVIIALVAYRITNNLSDFVLGGRQLSGPVAALSAGASDMSAWLLLGLPGAVYIYGLNQIWLPIGLTLGAYFSWLIIAKPLRVYSELANDSLTLPAFLDNRFKDSSGSIRVLLAIVTLVFFAFYTASGLVGAALLLQRFNFPYHQALLLGASIIVAYTFIGGFLAVSWTDFFQGTLMFICLLVVPYVALKDLGGVQATLDLIKDIDAKRLSPLTEFNWLLFINLISWGLGYFGQPHILVRFMAVSSAKDIPIARRICVSWMSFAMVGAVLTGLVGSAYFVSKDIHPESIFILFSQALFSPWISGILLAAIISSIMCAIDSQMIASSSAVTEDLYHRMFRRNATQKELIWVGRIAIILIAMVAIYFAKDPNSSVIEIVGFAWAGLGAAFGPAIIGALFWRKMSREGVLAGVILGSLTVVIWRLNSGGIFEIYEIIPGIFFACLGVIFGSKLSPPTEDIVLDFDSAWHKINSS
jgi:sodium/proline symporter